MPFFYTDPITGNQIDVASGAVLESRGIQTFREERGYSWDEVSAQLRREPTVLEQLVKGLTGGLPELKRIAASNPSQLSVIIRNSDLWAGRAIPELQRLWPDLPQSTWEKAYGTYTAQLDQVERNNVDFGKEMDQAILAGVGMIATVGLVAPFFAPSAAAGVFGEAATAELLGLSTAADIAAVGASVGLPAASLVLPAVTALGIGEAGMADMLGLSTAADVQAVGASVGLGPAASTLTAGTVASTAATGAKLLSSTAGVLGAGASVSNALNAGNKITPASSAPGFAAPALFAAPNVRSAQEGAPSLLGSSSNAMGSFLLVLGIAAVLAVALYRKR